MNARLIKTLDWLRLTDETGALSLTNIAMVVVLTKFAVNPACDMTSAVSLITVMAGYSFKRFTQRKQRYHAQNSFKEAVLAPVGLEEMAQLRKELDQLRLAQGLTGLTPNITLGPSRGKA